MYTAYMIRTQIYIEDNLHRQITHLASEKGDSMAGIIRKFIREGLQKQKYVDSSGKQAMRNLLKINATGGPKDLSENVDHYLYGAPKRKK